MKLIFASLIAVSAGLAEAAYYSCRTSIQHSECLVKHVNLTVFTGEALLYTLRTNYQFVPGPQFCDGPTRREGHYADGEMTYTIGGFDLKEVGGPYRHVYLEMEGERPAALAYRLTGPGQTRTRLPLSCRPRGEDQ